MTPKKRGKPPFYDNSYKVAIARDYLTSDLGYGALAKKYGLELRTIVHFVKWYKAHYPQETLIQPEASTNSSSENEQQLSQQLRDAHLRIAGLEMLIATAQKELGIDLVKKPGTKQSHK